MMAEGGFPPSDQGACDCLPHESSRGGGRTSSSSDGEGTVASLTPGDPARSANTGSPTHTANYGSKWLQEKPDRQGWVLSEWAMGGWPHKRVPLHQGHARHCLRALRIDRSQSCATL